jgi:hypothetical protein
VEAELRRRIRAELTQARGDADGELDDGTLAEIIARAVAMALGWHLEAPEHTRNATLSSRGWRPAAGPRGGGRPSDFEDRPPRGEFEPRPPRGEFEPRPRRDEFEPRPPRGEFQPRPRRDDREPGDFERGPRRRGFPKGGGFPKRGGGGGFGPRRPPPRGR